MPNKPIDLANIDQARFWGKIIKGSSEGACWAWADRPQSGGYVYLRVQKGSGPKHKASRVSWAIHHNQDPGEAQTLHTCDNRTCTNPKHLFLGDARANMEDKVLKGRQSKGDTHHSKLYPEKYQGEKNGRAKLTKEQVLEIRLKYDEGATRSSIAASYGITEEQASNIGRRKSWRSV